MNVVSGPGDRWGFAVRQDPGGKSGLRRAARLVTPGGRAGDGTAMESATENKPPAQAASVIGRRQNLGQVFNGRSVW